MVTSDNGPDRGPHRGRATGETISSLLFVAILLSALFVGRWLTTTVEEHARGVRAATVDRLEASTGQTLSWEAVSPSVVRGITLYGVEVSDVATARRISVGLNLFSLLRGDPRDLIPTIEVDQPRITIVTPTQQRSLEQTLRFAAENAGGRRDFTLRIRRGTISYTREPGAPSTEPPSMDAPSAGSSSVAAEAISGDFSFLRTGIRGTVDAVVSAQLPAGGIFQDAPFAVSSRVQAELEISRDGQALDANVDLREIDGSHLLVDDQSFRIERRGDALRVERIRSDEPLDVAVQYRPVEGLLVATVVSESYLPRETLQLRGPWADLQPWLSTRISSDATVRYDLQDGFLNSQGSVTASSAHPDLPAPLTVSATYAVTPQEIRLDHFRGYSEGGSVAFRGGYRFGAPAPNGVLDFRSFSYGPVPQLDGRVTVSSTRGGAGLSGEALTVAGVSLFDVVATYTPGARYNSARLSVRLEEDDRGSVAVNARFSDLDDLNGEVRVRQISARQIHTILARLDQDVMLPELLDTARVDALARVDRRDGTLNVRVPYLTVIDPVHDDRRAGFSGEYRDGTLLVDQLYVVAGRNRIFTDGFVRFGTGGTIDFRTDLTVNALEYPIRGTYTPDGSLVLFGPSGVEVRVGRSGGGARLEALLTDIAVPVGSTRLSASVDGFLFSGDDWYVNSTDIVLSNVPAPAGGVAEVRLAVALRPGEANISVLSYEDALARLGGSIEVGYSVSGGIDVQATGRLAGFDTEERYRLAARYARGQVAADVRFHASPAQRLAPSVRSGTLSGTLQVAGTPAQPQARFFVETAGVRVDDTDVEARLLAYVDDRELRVGNAVVTLGTTTVDLSELRVDRDSGALNGEAEIRRNQPERRYAVTLQGDAGPLPELSPQALLGRPVSAQLTVGASEETGGVALPFLVGTYRFERQEGQTRLRRDDGAINVVVTDQGTFDMVLAEPLPIALEAAGRMGAEEVEVTVSGISVDIPAFSALVGLPGISVASGTARGALRVLGPPADPDLFGTLAVRDLELTTPVGPDSIGPVDSTMIFEEKTIRLPATQTTAGNAVVSLEGRALLSRLSLEQYEVQVGITGEPGFRVDDVFGPVRVDGYARGTMVIGGTSQQVRIQGDLVTTSTEIAVEERPEPEDTPDRGSILLDLDIETGRAVQFIWPDRDFPILRSNFATGQVLEIAVDSREEEFSLTGALEIQSGDVFYFDRSFLVRDGRIRFNETQDEFDPRLTARAELREVTPEGPVRIYLVADGQRLSEFSPRFESNPPLSGNEILAILGGNILEQTGAGSTNLPTALLSTSDVVTQFGVFRQFEQTVREQLDLDLFAIRTSVIQNVLLSAITPADEAAAQLSPSLGTFLNDTSVFMGRYLGDAVFGQLVLQMRSRDMLNPDEQDPGIQRLGGVLIDSEISLEWQTPFFLLEWNFAPQNPEELFIRDNTFTFSWSFSY